jgi:hypothetical protein
VTIYIQPVTGARTHGVSHWSKDRNFALNSHYYTSEFELRLLRNLDLIHIKLLAGCETGLVLRDKLNMKRVGRISREMVCLFPRQRETLSSPSCNPFSPSLTPPYPTSGKPKKRLPKTS